MQGETLQCPLVSGKSLWASKLLTHCRTPDMLKSDPEGSENPLLGTMAHGHHGINYYIRPLEEHHLCMVSNDRTNGSWEDTWTQKVRVRLPYGAGNSQKNRVFPDVPK